MCHKNNRILMLETSSVYCDDRLAAVFLAGKVEECRVGMKDLLEVYDKCTAENIKACELLLIEVS